eukprot:2769673-Amphidinium_carterae.1
MCARNGFNGRPAAVAMQSDIQACEMAKCSSFKTAEELIELRMVLRADFVRLLLQIRQLERLEACSGSV